MHQLLADLRRTYGVALSPDGADHRRSVPAAGDGRRLSGAGCRRGFLFALLNKRFSVRLLYRAAVPLYTALLAPSVPGGLPAAAACGLAMSLLCGMIAGSYLHRLAFCTDKKHRAQTFGIGYGAATVAGGALSLPQTGTLVLCGVLGAVAVCLSFLPATVFRSTTQRCCKNISPILKRTYRLALSWLFP